MKDNDSVVIELGFKGYWKSQRWERFLNGVRVYTKIQRRECMHINTAYDLMQNLR